MARKTTNIGGDGTGVAPVGVLRRTFPQRKWPSPAYIVGGFSIKFPKTRIHFVIYCLKRKL